MGRGFFASRKGAKGRRVFHWKAGRPEWAHRGAGIFASRPLHGLHGESKRCLRAGLGVGIFTMKSMKGMKVSLHAGIPLLCVLGAFVVKYKRRCGVGCGAKIYPALDVSLHGGTGRKCAGCFCPDRGAVFCRKCSEKAGPCGVQQVASSVEAGPCGVHRGASTLSSGRCSAHWGASTRLSRSFSTFSSSNALVSPLCKMPLQEVKKPGTIFTIKNTNQMAQNIIAVTYDPPALLAKDAAECVRVSDCRSAAP